MIGRIVLPALAGLLTLGLAVAVVLGARWCAGDAGDTAIAGERLTTFPVLDRAALDPTQAAIATAAEREFAAPGPGTKYADGIAEPWCADFVSWVMRAAGVPYANPNSGSWRIPGVYTLKEYYEAEGRFAPIAEAPPPKAGDVLLYHKKSAFGEHVNLVLAARDGVVTTIGGNEFGEIRIHRFALAEVRNVLGVGLL
ncbi:CHAP domain-containing protein [Nocardia sp. NPDC057353]|uniref:CHAP domain-containing protein n=1 Tax=Nocardia sp. NPDC057353 TaxID=3346104 RepID=UPI003644B5CA